MSKLADMNRIIYKIVNEAEWRAAETQSHFAGSSLDLKDGFIHFSTAGQVQETAARHFAGQNDLLLLAIDTRDLGEALKWEASRGGALFPHLYDRLARAAVKWKAALPLDQSGRHVFPALEA